MIVVGDQHQLIQSRVTEVLLRAIGRIVIFGNGGIAELISTIHSSLDSKLSNVLTQLSGIETRIISLETRQTTLEQEVRYSSTLSSSPGGSDSIGSSTKRKCVTPVELQVCRYAVALYFRFLSQFRVEFVLSTIHYKMIKLMNRKDKYTFIC